MLTVSVGAQTPEKQIDSLKLRLGIEQNKDTIIKLNTTIARLQKNSTQINEAVETLHHTIRFSKKNQIETGIGDAALLLSQIYLYNINEPDSAFYYTSKAITIFKKADIKNKLSRAYFLRSIAFQIKSDFENQLKNVLLAMEYAEKSKDNVLLALFPCFEYVLSRSTKTSRCP